MSSCGRSLTGLVTVLNIGPYRHGVSVFDDRGPHAVRNPALGTHNHEPQSLRTENKNTIYEF